jgi:hypothetical protein
MLAGRTPIQALLDELRVDGCVYDYVTDMTGHLTRHFFPSPHLLLPFVIFLRSCCLTALTRQTVSSIHF